MGRSRGRRLTQGGMSVVRRYVVTGAPGAGKTVLVDGLRRREVAVEVPDFFRTVGPK